MPLVCNTEPACKALICCGEDSFENYSAAGSDVEVFFNQEVSYTSQCPPNYNCTPVTVTIPANANKPATNNPPTPAFPPGPAPCEGPFTGATQAEANAAALKCAQDSANAQTPIGGPIIFYNVEQSVNCPEGFAGGPFIVPANAVASMISQADANAEALTIAQGLAAAGCVASSCEGCLSPDGRVIVGDFPSAAAMAPISGSGFEDYVFVANNAGGTVSVIDFATETELTQIAIGSDPRNLIFVPLQNKVYVNAVGGLFVIDPTTFGVTGPLTLPGAVTAADLSGRHFCLDTINDKVYIPAEEAGVSDGNILQIDVFTDTVTILVALPLGTPGVDSYGFGLRCAHTTTNDRIYAWYAFTDLVDGANNEYRVKVYNPSGTEVDEIVISNGDAFSSTNCLSYYFESKDKVYVLGLAGDSATPGLKVINPATNTITASVSEASSALASLDINEDEDLLVIHNSAASNNVVFIQASSNTITCKRTALGSLAGDGLGQPASLDGRTFVPRADYDDCTMYICNGCTFLNSEQTVECPIGETGGPFTVPAGSYSSCVSQADADSQALADAQAMADAQCQSCVNHPVQDLVWTMTGDCGSSSGAGGTVSLDVAADIPPGNCEASTTLIGSCNEYTLSIEVVTWAVATTSAIDGPSAASFVSVVVDGISEFSQTQGTGGPPGVCTGISGGGDIVTHLIPAGVGTHTIALTVQNGSLPFPPGPCACNATFDLTPLTPP